MSRRTRNVVVFLIAFPAGVILALLAFRKPMELLTLDSVRRAREVWREAGPRSYDVRYRLNDATYDVEVRDGIVAEVNVNGQRARSAEWGAYSIEGLFDLLVQESEHLADPAGPFSGGSSRVTARVRFDPETGVVRRYLRSGGSFGRGAAIEMIELRKMPNGK